jgi:hypothetical protein
MPLDLGQIVDPTKILRNSRNDFVELDGGSGATVQCLCRDQSELAMRLLASKLDFRSSKGSGSARCLRPKTSITRQDDELVLLELVLG